MLFIVYGNFDKIRARASVLSALLQQGVPIEVILVEATPNPLAAWKSLTNLKHVGLKVRSQRRVCPGLLRNIALLHARGDYVYFSDADIVFSHEEFLVRSLMLIDSMNRVLIRPPKLRIPIEDAEAIASRFLTQGWQALLSLKWQEDRFATISDNVKYKEVTNGDREYTARDIDYSHWVLMGRQKQFSPTIWQDIFHPGSIFAPRKAVLAVGGYCNRFATWGCDDADLQFKLATKFEMCKYPREYGHYVYHLDHTREYYDPDVHADNKSHYVSRCARDTSDVLSEDKYSLERLKHALRLSTDDRAIS